jgi:cysteine desulfurase
MSRVYLDHNATSPMAPAVRRALSEAMERIGGNPSSPHAEGRAARRELEEARELLAGLLGFNPSEVVFTSGGTEANNLALRGMRAGGASGAPERIIASKVEHPSVLESCRSMAASGASVTLLDVDREGRVDPDSLRAALAGGERALVSIMHANNETGVIQPVADLAAIAAAHGALFHTDIVQSLGKLPAGVLSRVLTSDVAACSVAAHKIGGPAGIGALAVRAPASLAAQITGGPQERRARAGTEPALLSAGFAAALGLAGAGRDGRPQGAGAGRPGAESAGPATGELRDRIEAAIREIDPVARVHGAGAERLDNTSSFYLPGAAGRYLVLQLDLAGFAVSTGSACSTGAARPSHVLGAMGCGAEEARDSVRVSLGRGSTSEEIELFIEALREAVARARGSGGSDRRDAAPVTTRIQ